MDTPHHQQRRAGAAEAPAPDRPAFARPTQLVEPEGVDGVEKRPHFTHFHAPANVRAMAIKLRDLKTEARTLARAGQHAAALAAHEHMLARNPLDLDSRRKIPDLLLKLGDQAGAIEVYRAVAMHDVRSGHLLPAIVACKMLESLGAPTADIVKVIAATYGHGAPALAKFAARQAPIDLEGGIEPLEGDAAADPAALAQRARERALDLSVFVQYPEQFLAVSFFSELPPELFATALQSLRLVRAGDGEMVIREGQVGTAFYFVAAGELRVFARAGGSATKAVERGRLHEGSLFGEMALVTEQAAHGVRPGGGRGGPARDRTLGGAEADRRGAGARRAPGPFRARAPAQEPADHVAAVQAVRSTAADGAHQALRGARLRARHGDHPRGGGGQGLFVILLGEVEVVRADTTGRERTLARLGAGEIFGEMSLLGDRATTATVRTVATASILFLGRDYFRRLVDALPALRQYFEELSKHRRRAQV